MTTTGAGSTGIELLESLSWLSDKGGIVLLHKEEVHVYRGSIHKCVEKVDGSSGAGVNALLEALRQVRLEYERHA